MICPVYSEFIRSVISDKFNVNVKLRRHWYITLTTTNIGTVCCICTLNLRICTLALFTEFDNVCAKCVTKMKKIYEDLGNKLHDTNLSIYLLTKSYNDDVATHMFQYLPFVSRVLIL